MSRPRKTVRHKRTGKYKSVLESKVAKQLGKKAKYEPERVSYVMPKTYAPDFIVYKTNGIKMMIEVKGWLRAEDQQKMKCVKHCNPHLDIRFYFPNDGRVQGSSMRNSQWCVKYGFPYCIGSVPKEWLI